MPRETKYLLIGGGLACYHAARQLRRADAEGAILLVSEEPVLPYDRPPLSKEFLRGEKDLDAILYMPPADWSDLLKVDLALGAAVTALDPAQHQATLADGETIHFEKALIATGGRPIPLPVPGANLAGVHYLRTAADAQAIQAEAQSGRKAAVIGAGFIGLEVAASLTKLGVQVTVIEAMPHIWPRFADEDLAAYIQGYCSAHGVAFVTGDAVAELRGSDRVNAVVTKSGAVIDCDFACVGIGIRPNVELAQVAGLEVTNGIVVDEYLRTSHPDIYAAGDVANYPDVVFNKRRRVEHWGHAEYCGQIAGRNMAGGENAYSFLTYVWSDIFDLHLEFAGDEGEHDQAILRGSYEDDKFCILYLQGGLMTAYFAVNTEAREFGLFRRLILTKTDLRGREADIANPDFSVRDLLA